MFTYNKKSQKNIVRHNVKCIIGLLCIICASISVDYSRAKEFMSDGVICEGGESIEKYACLINQSAKGSVRRDIGYEFLVAVETMSFVQLAVSSGRYSYLARKLCNKFSKPGLDAQICLDLGYGICSQHEKVFSAILKKLGIDTRIVQFWFTQHDGKRNSHVAVEAKIDEKWAYFDVSAGAVFFRDISDPESFLSIEEIIDIGVNNVDVSVNNNISWNFSRKYSGYDLLEYLHALDLDYAVDGEGKVRPVFEWNRVSGKMNTKVGQKFIGDKNVDNNSIGYEYIIFVPVDGKYDIKANFSYSGCTESAEMCVNDKCKTIQDRNMKFETHTLSASGNLLNVQTDDDVCIVVFKSLEIDGIE